MAMAIVLYPIARVIVEPRTLVWIECVTRRCPYKTFAICLPVCCQRFKDAQEANTSHHSSNRQSLDGLSQCTGIVAPHIATAPHLVLHVAQLWCRPSHALHVVFVLALHVLLSLAFASPVAALMIPSSLSPLGSFLLCSWSSFVFVFVWLFVVFLSVLFFLLSRFLY